MAEFIPLGGIVPGQIQPRFGEDFDAGTFSAAKTFTEFFMSVTDAPSTTPLVVQVRNAASGGGQGVELTIAVGAKSASATGSLSLTAGQTLKVRPISGDGSAMNLGGWAKAS